MQCCFCEKEVESVEAAIELGWYPDFWYGEVSYQGPVCPDCQQKHLFRDDDGEYVLKPDHPLPALAVPEHFVGIGKGKALLKGPLLVTPKFSLGFVMADLAALKAIADAGQAPDFFLTKHVQGDWGAGSGEDKVRNDQAVATGGRIVSVYRTLLNVQIVVTTQAADDKGKRSATTITLSSQQR